MATIKRYNSNNRRRAYPHDVLIDVELSNEIPKVDWSKSENVPDGLPGYVSKSVCDKSCFNPASGVVSPGAAVPRVPVYDTKDGVKPDIGLNLGWLRSAARDRVEIDNAIKTLENAISAEKAQDMAQLKALQQKREDLEQLKGVLDSNNTSDSSDSTTQN